MPGPPKTPTAVLRMRGSWLAKTRKGEPPAVPGAPPCPGWLTEAGRAMWPGAIEDLRSLGVLSRSDGAVIAMYCETLAMCAALSLELGKVKPTYKAFPALFRARQTAWATMLRAASKLGLTPSDRPEVKTTPATSDDKRKYFDPA